MSHLKFYGNTEKLQFEFYGNTEKPQSEFYGIIFFVYICTKIQAVKIDYDK